MNSVNGQVRAGVSREGKPMGASDEERAPLVRVASSGG